MLPQSLFRYSARIITRKSTCLQSAPQRGHRTIIGAPITTWEPDRRSGCPSSIETPPFYTAFTPANMIDTYRYVKGELKKFKKEVVDWSYADPFEWLRHGDVRIECDLRDPVLQDQWVVTADSDYNQGRSWGKFEITQRQTGVFYGNLDKEPVKDGWTAAAGYANVRSPKKMKSFARQIRYDWTGYTHLVVKLRGDGRTYMINLNCPGEFDMHWNKLYNYPLHTRGGPYWQTTRIPFSKFFMSHKGRIQDKQNPVHLATIEFVSFTCSDLIDGPYRLEIDYIAIEYDENHTEEFAYEMYEATDPYILGT